MKESQTAWHICVGGLLINLLLLGAAFFFYYVIIQPTFITVATATNDLVFLEQRVTSLWSAERVLEKRKNDLEQLNVAFLDLEDAVPFITLLESVAKTSGVKITINAPSFQHSESTGSAEFSLSATGNFSSVIMFIQRIELLPYFTDVSTLTLTSKTGEVEAHIQLMVLTL